MAGADGCHDAGATKTTPWRQGCNVKIARYLSNDS